MGGVAEFSRWIGRERRENLPIVHAGLRHQGEFFGGVIVIGVANVGPEQNVATCLGVGAQLVHHLSDETGARLLGNFGFASFHIEESQGRNQTQMRALELGSEFRSPWWGVWQGVSEYIDAAVHGDA